MLVGAVPMCVHNIRYRHMQNHSYPCKPLFCRDVHYMDLLTKMFLEKVKPNINSLSGTKQKYTLQVQMHQFKNQHYRLWLYNKP